jgi:RHS repeat-associated protein
VAARITASGTVAWYLTDRLGSVRVLTDSTGAVIDLINYDGFGNIISESNAANSDRYLFTGREFDRVTGLQYNRARYYDPTTGRWTTEDPTGFAGGDANLYRYAGNDPTNQTDPYGLDSRLSAITEFGPIPYYLGGFDWGIHWSLHPRAQHSGVIIQYIHDTFKLTRGSKYFADDGKWNYFEAWPVRKGGSSTSISRRGTNDYFSIPSDSRAWGTAGRIDFVGRAFFVEGITLRTLMQRDSFRPNNPQTHAGILYSVSVARNAALKRRILRLGRSYRRHYGSFTRHEIRVSWNGTDGVIAARTKILSHTP